MVISPSNVPWIFHGAISMAKMWPVMRCPGWDGARLGVAGAEINSMTSCSLRPELLALAGDGRLSG